MYFVGTSTGVYSTTSLNGASTTWVLESPDVIGNMIVRGLVGRQSDGYIAIATHGAGIFTVNLNPNAKPVIAVVTDVRVRQRIYRLFSSYESLYQTILLNDPIVSRLNKLNRILLYLFAVLLFSCSSEKENNYLASYKNEQLLLEEVYDNIPLNISDTNTYISNYINDWLKTKVVYNKAKLYIEVFS